MITSAPLAPPTDRKLKFLDQTGGEGLCGQAGNAQTIGMTHDGDPLPRSHRAGAASVTPQHRGFRTIWLDVEVDASGWAHNKGTSEKSMGAERHHEHGIEIGPHDWAAGGEGIGGGAGRGRDEDPITTPALHGQFVDGCQHVEHAASSCFLQGQLIDGKRIPAMLTGMLGDGDLEDQPVLNGVFARTDLINQVGHVGAFQFGQESDMSQVDADHGDVPREGPLRRPQDRTVTAEDDDDLSLVGELSESLNPNSGQLLRHRFNLIVGNGAANIPAIHLGDELGGRVKGVVTSGMGDDDNVSGRARVVHVTTVAARCDLSGPLSPTRPFQQDEVLNVSVLSGQGAVALVAH